MYALKNKPQSEQTATPEKYPQKSFKDKPCRMCSKWFSPKAPSHMYCTQPCADDSMTDKYLVRTYAITWQDYKDMYSAQLGRCAICKGEGFTMAEHHKLKLVVDHCHTSGQVRGLLCHNCNRALGLLQDDTEALQTAIEYLEETN